MIFVTGSFIAGKLIKQIEIRNKSNGLERKCNMNEEECQKETPCPICGNTLSNRFSISPGGCVKAWCSSCNNYVPLEEYRVLIERRSNG